VEVEQLAAVPKIAWPKKPRSNPATIGPATQRAILVVIPEETRGVLLAMALLCPRPRAPVEMTSRQLRGDGWITIDVSRADRGLFSGTKSVKNEEPRTLPLPDELAEWIERWVPRERLFVNQDTAPVRSQNRIPGSSMGPSRVRPSQSPEGRHLRPGVIVTRVQPARLRAHRVPRPRPRDGGDPRAPQRLLVSPHNLR
jgi:hypothetical protein